MTSSLDITFVTYYPESSNRINSLCNIVPNELLAVVEKFSKLAHTPLVNTSKILDYAKKLISKELFKFSLSTELISGISIQDSEMQNLVTEKLVRIMLLHSVNHELHDILEYSCLYDFNVEIFETLPKEINFNEMLIHKLEADYEKEHSTFHFKHDLEAYEGTEEDAMKELKVLLDSDFNDENNGSFVFLN